MLVWGLTILVKALSSLDHPRLFSLPLLCCKRGLRSPAAPILLPRLSSQTWLFAHSCGLLFTLKFFGFLAALISFRLQPCPKTLTRAVIPPFLQQFKFNQPVKSPRFLINGCFCLADKIPNFGVCFYVKHASILRSDIYT